MLANTASYMGLEPPHRSMVIVAKSLPVFRVNLVANPVSLTDLPSERLQLTCSHPTQPIQRPFSGFAVIGRATIVLVATTVAKALSGDQGDVHSRK